MSDTKYHMSFNFGFEDKESGLWVTLNQYPFNGLNYDNISDMINDLRQFISQELEIFISENNFQFEYLFLNLTLITISNNYNTKYFKIPVSEIRELDALRKQNTKQKQ